MAKFVSLHQLAFGYVKNKNTDWVFQVTYAAHTGLHTQNMYIFTITFYSTFLPLSVKYMQSLESAQLLPVHNLHTSKTQK